MCVSECHLSPINDLFVHLFYAINYKYINKNSTGQFQFSSYQNNMRTLQVQ